MIERTDELAVFVAVATAGSLSAAARGLAVPINRVSRKLARLEERLGVSLVTRTTRRLKLSREGERLLPRAHAILDQVQAAEREVQTADLRGLMRVGVPTLFAQFGLLDEVVRILRAHPELDVEVMVQDAPIHLVESGCDAVVVVGRPADSANKLIKLGSVVPVLAASEAYVRSQGKPTTVRELRDHACLRFVGDGPQTHWPLVGPNRRRCKAAVGRGLSSNSSRVLFDAMLSGAGIGLALDVLLRRTDNDLVRVLPEHHHAPFELFVMRSATPEPCAHARLAVDLLSRAVSMAT
jgi:DNA-binding transcriptional LysR family regulator